MITDWEQWKNNGRYVLGPNGEPVPEKDLLVWSRWFGEIDARRVAFTRVGPVTVSTVFLGFDHAFGGGPPVLWETCCFDSPDGGDHMQRYTSREEAVLGHNDVVREIRDLLQELKP